MKRSLNILKICFTILGAAGVVMAIDAWTRKGGPQIEGAVMLKTRVAKNSRRNLPIYGFNGDVLRVPPWTNSRALDSVATIPFRIIRYPGGTITNWWDWKIGWLAPDTVRNMKMSPGYLAMKGNPNDLNNLKILVDRMQCDVVFCLNMISSNVDDQLDMLKAAEKIGIKIKYVELGNEYNLQENEARIKYPTANNYAKECNNWIRKIKSVYPSAEIAIVGGNKNYASDTKNWNEEVLRDAPDADAIVAHVYALPYKVIDSNGINFKDLYDNFNDQYLKQGFASIPSNKKVWMTEYNIHWAYSPDNLIATKRLFQKNLFNWDDALAVILMTSTGTQLSNQMEMVVNHDLANITIFAAIDVEKDSFKKLPNGIGMQAWLTSCYNMTTMQKLSFSAGSHTYGDFEVLGWQFSNTQTSNTLLVNFLPSSVRLNVGTFIKKSATCEIKYADKRSLATPENIKTEILNINSASQIELPPYSFAVIK